MCLHSRQASYKCIVPPGLLHLYIQLSRVFPVAFCLMVAHVAWREHSAPYRDPRRQALDQVLSGGVLWAYSEYIWAMSGGFEIDQVFDMLLGSCSRAFEIHGLGLLQLHIPIAICDAPRAPLIDSGVEGRAARDCHERSYGISVACSERMPDRLQTLGDCDCKRQGGLRRALDVYVPRCRLHGVAVSERHGPTRPVVRWLKLAHRSRTAETQCDWAIVFSAICGCTCTVPRLCACKG